MEEKRDLLFFGFVDLNMRLTEYFAFSELENINIR